MNRFQTSLLIAGIAIAFAWPLIPLYLGPTIITVIFMISIPVVLFGISAIVKPPSLRDILKTRRRILDTTIDKCLICDATLPMTTWREMKQIHGPHYETTHLDAWKSDQKYRRLILISLSTLISYSVVASVLVVLWASANDLLLVIFLYPAAALMIFLVLFLPKNRRRRLEHYRNAWNQSLQT